MKIAEFANREEPDETAFIKLKFVMYLPYNALNSPDTFWEVNLQKLEFLISWAQLFKALTA